MSELNEETVSVEVTYLSNGDPPVPGLLAVLQIAFPVFPTEEINQLPPWSQVSVATAIQAVLTRELEDVRQERFGSAPIGFQVVDTRLGSLTFAVLITILIAGYHGLKDYKSLRESTLLFVDDIKSVALRIRHSAIAEYLRRIHVELRRPQGGRFDL